MNSEKWVVVVDDSNCTVGMGGEGYMWEVMQEDNFYYRLKKKNIIPNDFFGPTTGPYDKSIFRDASEEEIKNWKENGQKATVPQNNKKKLYEFDNFPFS
jgi:hypothetical protein